MTGETLPSRTLAIALRAGGQVHFAPSVAEVYEAHFKYVWRCLRSLGVRDAALDDAVQEVFLVVQRKLAAFDGAAELSTWLYAIVIRVARRHRAQAARDAHRFPERDTRGHAPAPPPSSAADLRCEVEHNERLALAQRALGLLDDAKREVFVLACIEGMSAPEIAELTSVPLNTVYSRLRAARLAFADAVQTLSAEDSPGGTRA
jgi:RNA polymerase sigma-70 factor (ECF subfamily)